MARKSNSIKPPFKMTIGYSTHWPKTMPSEYASKPTYFVDKIWAGLISELESINISDYEKFTIAYKNQFESEMSEYEGLLIDPKLHTMREDKTDRWKVGMKIHPVINNRTKNRFQFTPLLEVKAIQKIEIIYSNEALCDWYGVEPVLKIDDRILSVEEMEVIAKNDGFESAHHFCHWFKKDFTGKIIHWTDLKY